VEAELAAGVLVGAAARPLTILQVAPRTQGGIGRHVMGLVTGLPRGRFRLVVAGPAEDSILEEAHRAGVPVAALEVPAGGGPLATLCAAWQLARIAAREKADLIHTHSFSAGVVGALAKRLRPGPALVCTVHHYAPESAGWKRRWTTGLMASRAARIITVSDALRSEFANSPAASAKLLTIPNGVDLSALVNEDRGKSSLIELGVSAGEQVVGMVARLAPQKGIEEFVRAAALILKSRPDTRFVLIGEGPLRGRAEELRQQLGVRDRLLLAGSRPDARELIAGLDLLVVPSHSEGSSLISMEAMALGKAVVASRVGGIPEVVEDGVTGVLVEAGDAEGLARAIAELLADEPRREKLGRAGKARVWRDFDSRLMVERTSQVYGDLARKKLEAGRS